MKARKPRRVQVFPLLDCWKTPAEPYKIMPSGVVDKLLAGKITYRGGLAKYHKETP